MNPKRIISWHFANDKESWGLTHPTLSNTYPLDQTGQATYHVHKNLHQGKVGVLFLAPQEGLRVRPEAAECRARHLQAIDRFRDL